MFSINAYTAKIDEYGLPDAPGLINAYAARIESSINAYAAKIVD